MKSVWRPILDRVWAFSQRGIPRLFYVNGGIGDELLLTAVARAARVQRKPIHILTEMPHIWHGNSDPVSVQVGVDRWFYAQTRGWITTSIVHVAYQSGGGRHIAEQMAEKAEVRLPIGWRPVLSISPPVLRCIPTRIVVQNSCSGARYAATTKEWPQTYWRELVNRLVPEYEVIQIGTAVDPALPGTQDRRGVTTLIQAARLIRSAACFLGLESGLMHIAAAAGTPAVIIHGGRTHEWETGYPFNRHLTRKPPCVGCSLNTGCPQGIICMDISVEEVEAAVRETLAAQVCVDKFALE